jgi:hypothetical protein
LGSGGFAIGLLVFLSGRCESGFQLMLVCDVVLAVWGVWRTWSHFFALHERCGSRLTLASSALLLAIPLVMAVFLWWLASLTKVW